MIASATQFVIDLETTLKSGKDSGPVWQQMVELDAILEPLILLADNWSGNNPALSASGPEAVVAQSLRSMARIKLNR